MSKMPCLSIFALVALSACASAEPAPPPIEPTRDEARVGSVEAALYPTELVMDHQAALGLTDAQASAIREELQRTQRELVDAEWELRREREALASVLAHPRVDEDAALAAAERVIAREGAIKRLHLLLLVRIKNQLSAEQQVRLTALRE
jgi:Spy/CpxP family protein refolding chaperone